MSELLDTGLYETFIPEREMTINDLLKELSLDVKYFGILLNGKKVKPNTKIGPDDELVILPYIAGGN